MNSYTMQIEVSEKLETKNPEGQTQNNVIVIPVGDATGAITLPVVDPELNNFLETGGLYNIEITRQGVS